MERVVVDDLAALAEASEKVRLVVKRVGEVLRFVVQEKCICDGVDSDIRLSCAGEWVDHFCLYEVSLSEQGMLDTLPIQMDHSVV